MTTFAIISGGTAPGTTTSVALLASVWPAPLLVADCDPSSGDLFRGWLSPLVLGGHLHYEPSLATFAGATRRAAAQQRVAISPYLQLHPDLPHLRLLAGAQGRAQSHLLDEAAWQRIAVALGELRTECDVVIDLGRLSVNTPWPLLRAADLILIAVRPVLRSVLAARDAVEVMRHTVDAAKLGVLACCVDRSDSAFEICDALDLPLWAELPTDARTAAVFSDGVEVPRTAGNSSLARAAAASAERLRLLALGSRVQTSPKGSSITAIAR